MDGSSEGVKGVQHPTPSHSSEQNSGTKEDVISEKKALERSSRLVTLEST